MKNLLDYGVQEMNAEEKVRVSGGWTRTYTNSSGQRVTDWYRRDGYGHWVVYRTVVHAQQ